MLAMHRELSLFNGNCTMWFDNKYCVAYGAWTFYDKVGNPRCPPPQLFTSYNAYNHFGCIALSIVLEHPTYTDDVCEV